MGQGVKPEAGVSLGQVFLGKYRVDSIIGHGGMGVVAECTHLALNERVAIKMLRQDVLLDQDAVQRFVREAQAAVKLKSEYVARVSDVGTFENGVPYMVMEYLEGHDLGQLLEQRGVLPMAWASELMLQTCEALAEAHSLGIVHRDVKPTNLFVTWRPDGSALIKVLDFGISKSPLGTDMQLTQTQSLLGTPAYMSPEQMRSARMVDSRTDIWSLGTVFYEILEGRRPFEAESFSEMCVKVAVDPPAPMVNTPPALQQVILKCLAKQSEQRYANMAELGRDLVPFVTDAHQAQRLVERMTRMLRRSQHSWDDNSSSVSRPRVTEQEASGAMRAPRWSTSSDPANVAYGNAEPTPKPPLHRQLRDDPSQPFVRQDPSQPYATAPSTIMTTRPTRRWPLVLLGFALLISAGVAIGIVLSGSAGDDTKALSDQGGSSVTEPENVIPLKTDVTKAGPGSAATQTLGPPSAGSGVGSGAGSSAATLATNPTPPIGSGAGSGAPRVVKKQALGTGVVKKVPKPIPKEAKPEVKDPLTAGSGAGSATTKKCDPFSNMHDCRAN